MQQTDEHDNHDTIMPGSDCATYVGLTKPSTGVVFDIRWFLGVEIDGVFHLFVLHVLRRRTFAMPSIGPSAVDRRPSSLRREWGLASV